jgi:hypothetical protein
MTFSKYTLILLSLFFVFTSETLSQENINNYKYVIIPTKYDFLKSEDQYQVNSLTKFLFNKYGYKAFMENEEFPEDLKNNRCLALYADVAEQKAFMKTKLQIDLKDCNKKLIQSSKVGESREKEYSKTFNLALRDAFETFQFANYKYEPSQEIIAKTSPKTSIENTDEKAEIERLKKELETLKEEQKPVVVEEITAEKIVTLEDLKNTNTTVQDDKAFQVLYAQPIDNGYQIVDTTPKVVMILQFTGVEGVFSVKDSKSLVYKKEGVWMYSKDGNILAGEPINLKF